ncbi:MAG: hypothetical protein R6V35_04750 [Candidatus Nanohaloarchaea archaeon]
MSLLETILGLPEGVVTAILLVSIILAVMLAFKVMEMVFETVTIAALSGAFYAAMIYLFGGSFAFNDLLLFSFLGASLYMLYGFLITAFTAAETILKIPYKIFMGVFRPTKKYSKKGYRELKKKIERRNEEEVEEKKNKSTKEVVLNDD